MIFIKNGEKLIYDPRNPHLKLVNPILRMEDNAAGSLTFKVYNTNLNYGTIKKLFPIISVARDEKIIFKGRVVTDRKDFYNGKTIEVEGKMAFFNDSYLEPFEFAGNPDDLFRMIIENHNSQVNEWQKFKVGRITVSDNNDYIVRSSEHTLNTWNALKDKCFKSSLGGHIHIRYEEDGDYIDWLADYETVSSQSIEFAKNMIDLVSEVDATETYTAIRPVGAEVDGKRIDISSVNGGKKYIVNEEKAKEYGVIFAPEEESKWDDVTLPDNLLKKAKEKIFGSFVTLKETYEIKAVDLNLTDKSIEALNVCEYVPVNSKPHGINANYFLRKIDLAIAAPQNSIFHLGSSKRTLSDMNATTTQNLSDFNNDMNFVRSENLTEYSKTEDVEIIVQQAVKEVESSMLFESVPLFENISISGYVEKNYTISEYFEIPEGYEIKVAIPVVKGGTYKISARSDKETVSFYNSTSSATSGISGSVDLILTKKTNEEGEGE